MSYPPLRKEERVPPELYAIALVVLMGRENVHHFEIDLNGLDPEKSRGLSLDFEIDQDAKKITVTTGRCDCPGCGQGGGTQ